MKNLIFSFFQNLVRKINELDQRLKFWILFAVVVLLNSTFAGIYYLSPSENFKVGKPAPKTVISPKHLKIVDAEATKRLKEKARKSVPIIYSLDPAVEAVAQNKLNHLFEIIEGYRKSENPDLNKILKEVKAQGFQYLTEEDVKFLLAMGDESYQQFRTYLQDTIRTLFAIRIKPEEKEIAINKAGDILSASGLSDSEVRLGVKILQPVLLPNYLPDMLKTEEARKQAENKVQEVIIEKQKGEVVIREGEIVTREVDLVLKRIGIGRHSQNYLRFAAVFILSVLLHFLIFLYLLFFGKNMRNFYLKASFVFTVILFYGILTRSFIGSSYQYLIPLAFVVVSTIFFLPLKLAPGILLSALLLTSLYPEASLLLIVTLAFPAFIAIFLLSSVEQQSHVIRSGFYLGALAAATSLLATLMAGNDFQNSFKIVVESTFGNFLSVVLSIGLLPFFESVFHTTSSLRLVELSSPNQPLLRELMTRAPGTYNHSVMTANLAEAAAHAIGANPLLARVGSYYHDIGKIKRPIFFAENQVGIKNPHDETNPSLSKLIISSHVRDGIEIARKHGLPEEIIDIIAEHHGTSLIYPIYKKAVEQKGNENVEENAFRYPYKKPSTKEAAIVMLADSVEAASRTIYKKTPERIEKMIKEIIKQKLDDHQLEEAPITLSDLKKIERAFTNVLSGLYHERIEYPNVAELRKSMNGKG